MCIYLNKAIPNDTVNKIKNTCVTKFTTFRYVLVLVFLVAQFFSKSMLPGVACTSTFTIQGLHSQPVAAFLVFQDLFGF